MGKRGIALSVAVLVLVGCETPPRGAGAASPDPADSGPAIRKEPAYASKSPKYCLLVFGPKAETRVWLVLDLVSEPWQREAHKDAVYVDRNGNGDLTEPGERVACTLQEQAMHSSFGASVTYSPRFKIGDIAERNGGGRHTELTLEVDSYVQTYRPCRLSVKLNGRHTQVAGSGLLRFADRPQDAPVIHFNGPLAMRLHKWTGTLVMPAEAPAFYEEQKMARGQPFELCAQIGTPGRGDTFAALSTEAVPAGVHPVADVEFRPQDPGKPPIKIRIPLKQRG